MVIQLGWFLALMFVPSVTMAAGIIAWDKCDEFYLQRFKAKCGFLTVPLDSKNPAGVKIKIQVSMLRHNSSSQAYQGVMLVIGGGLGLMGSMFKETFPEDVAAAYDWIGYNERGLKGNQPTLSCIPDYFKRPFPDYTPSTAELENDWLNRSKTYAMACGKKNSTLLKHMTTVDRAEDIEQIRIALKVDKINIYALSSSTYVSQMYATLYPNRIRRMILDSNVDPRKVWFREIVNEVRPMERNFERWFSWIAKYDEVYHLGKTASAVDTKWKNVLKELKVKPIKGVIGPSEWIDIFVLVAHYEDSWADLALTLTTWIKKKDASLLMLYYKDIVHSNDIDYAQTLATICTDREWPSWSVVNATFWRLYKTAPTFAWRFQWLYGPCLFWPVKGGIPLKVVGDKIGKVLLLANSQDAVTPLENSLEVRRRFKQASLISVTNAMSHIVTFPYNTCVLNRVIEYLRSGKTPARKPGDRIDLKCVALPEIKPDEN